MKVRFKKITIVAERLLQDQVVDLLKKHQVTGWTAQSVTGEGSRGLRASEWEGSNVQIYTLVPEALAETIMQDIAEHYFENWSVVVYSQDVDVLRPGKYQQP
jgi:nitrogen regulatory protein P-II 2